MTLENKVELLLIKNILDSGDLDLIAESVSEEELDNIEANMIIREKDLLDKFVQQYK